MFLYMVRLRRKNFKITQRIVKFVAVLMMHDLKRSEFSLQVLFQHKAMLMHLFPVSVSNTPITFVYGSCAPGCAVAVMRAKLSCGASGSKRIETPWTLVGKRHTSLYLVDYWNNMAFSVLSDCSAAAQP